MLPWPSLPAGAQRDSDPHHAVTGAPGWGQNELPRQENPREGSGASAALCRTGALSQAARAASGHGLYGPREGPRLGAAVPGIWHWAVEFQPHPTNDNLPGERGLPSLYPIPPGGCLGCWGSQVLELAGAGSRLGISMTLKGRGQPWGRASGMQVTRAGDSCSGTSSDLMSSDGVGPHLSGCPLQPPAPGWSL